MGLTRGVREEALLSAARVVLSTQGRIWNGRHPSAHASAHAWITYGADRHCTRLPAPLLVDVHNVMMGA
jgi:hypothetical protein